MSESTADEAAVFTFIHQVTEATANDIHTHVLPRLSRSQVYRKLAKLVEGGYLAVRMLAPERGNVSVRTYHLRLKGARAIGYASLSSAHYQQHTREVYQARHVKQELALWAARHGWRLLTSESDCRQALSGLFISVARSRYGEHFPAHTLMPAGLKIRPDLLLDTDTVLVLVIVGHPQASPAFWKRRLERYEAIFSVVRTVCFALTEQQAQDATAAIASAGSARRVLVLSADQVADLIQRLTQG